jgi:hypothetical protein
MGTHYWGTVAGTLRADGPADEPAATRPATPPRLPPLPPLPPDDGDDPLADATIVVHDPARSGVPVVPIGVAVGGVSTAPAHRATGAIAAPEPAAATPLGGSTGLSPEWQRLRYGLGGLLAVVLLGAFGWFGWRGRDPAPVSVAPLAGIGRVEIKVHWTQSMLPALLPAARLR